MTVPFLAAYRLVRVDRLCSPYNLPRNVPPGRRRRQPEGWDALSQTLQDVPDTTLLVFMDGELDRGNPMRSLIGDAAESQQFAPVKGRRLSEWVHRRAQAAGLHLTGRAERALIDRVGADMAALASELEKLQLYAGDVTVDEHVIEMLCPRNADAEIWDLTDAVGQGSSGPALRALTTLREEGRQTAPLLGAIANQMRRIVIAQEILDQGGDEGVVKEQLRIRHPFPAQKLTEQARRFDPVRARAALPRIRECDAAVRRFRRGLPGGMADDLALELLVVDLAAS